MSIPRIFTLIVAVGLFAGTGWPAETSASKPASPTVNETYPGLTSEALRYARLGELPKGTVLTGGDLSITGQEVDAELIKVPEDMRGLLEKNRFFLLEQIATKRLLLQEAQKASKMESKPTSENEMKMIQNYLDQQTQKIEVSDKDVSDFYEQNKEMCGGATLDQVKGELKQFVQNQKKQEAVTQFIRTLGQRMPIVIAEDWTKEQAALAMQNPVDEARRSGKPSLIDFGADGCVPCDMMAPILKDLTKKYEGRMNVQFIHVREQQILAARYGIQSIPVQVIFDKDGKEVFRHTGFLAQEELEKQIAALGVK